MTSFEFATPTRILFGPGVVREIGGVARALGLKACVVTGKTVERAGPVLALIEESGVETLPVAIDGEPTVDAVTRATGIAKAARCDLVIGLGGGSALDAAKAVSALCTNDGGVLDYLEVVGRGRPLTKVPLPFVAIPTTAGAGAEVTRNAVLTCPGQRFKASLRSPWLAARVALVDPELTRDLPPALTASTGLDALTQLIEPSVSRRANPMTDALCREGMTRAARSLRRAWTHGTDAGAREDMSMASLFGGLALANAGLGAVHGFAAPIGGMFPAPHGAVCAALLAPVTEANLQALRAREPRHPALERYDGIARVLTGDPDAVAADGVAWIRELVAELKIPGLGAYAVSREAIPELVDKAGRASSMKHNPIVLTESELAGILERAL